MAVRRVAQVVGLRPGQQERYLALHREVWPEVQARLRASHVTNYSIFRHGDVLFSYYEYTGDDHAADMAAIAADPATRRWWALTDPCQVPLPGAGPGSPWADAEEVFRLDEPDPGADGRG